MVAEPDLESPNFVFLSFCMVINGHKGHETYRRKERGSVGGKRRGGGPWRQRPLCRSHFLLLSHPSLQAALSSHVVERRTTQGWIKTGRRAEGAKNPVQREYKQAYVL